MPSYIEANSRAGSRELVRDVFRQFVPENSRILEVGSERGSLAYWLRGTPYHVQESDVNPGYVARRRNEGTTNIEVADVHNLPYYNGQWNTVVGLNFFDVLQDLDRAVAEIGRVLHANYDTNPETPGTVITMQDMGFNVHSFYRRFNDGDTVPFLCFNTLGYNEVETGLALVRRKDIPRLKKAFDKLHAKDEGLLRKLNSETRRLLSELQQDPANKFVGMPLSYHARWYKALLKSGVEYATVLSREEFPKTLRSALEAHHFDITELGYRERISYIDVHPVPLSFVYDADMLSYKIPRRAKMLIADVADESFSPTPDRRCKTKKGKFPVLSRMFVAVARKKE